MEKAILCNTQVVRNIMSGRQTQDRRPMKVQQCLSIDAWQNECNNDFSAKTNQWIPSFKRRAMPHFRVTAPWKVGEILWVRERAKLVLVRDLQLKSYLEYKFEYASDGERSEYIEIPDRIKPVKLGNCIPNGCFKELARTFLKVTRVWCEKVQDISEEDAYNEGIYYKHVPALYPTAKKGFCHLIDSIYQGVWDRNEWMFACEFEKVEKPHGN